MSQQAAAGSTDQISRDATVLQRQGANPQKSVWVSASAGSGKTTVLTDRLLRLLISGTRSEQVLCLTFTEAAKTEMLERLSQRLADWAWRPADWLRADLATLRGTAPTDEMVMRARSLFAQVVDAPIPPRVLTIHGFCQSLLRRFSIEAGIVPGFDVQEPLRAAAALATAREQVLRAASREPALATAIDTVSRHATETTFESLLAEVIANRARLARHLGVDGSISELMAALSRLLGLAPDTTPRSAALAAVKALDQPHLSRLVSRLAAGGDRAKNATKVAMALRHWLALPDDSARADAIDQYYVVWLTKNGTPRQKLVPKALQQDDSALVDDVLAAQQHAGSIQARVAAATILVASGALFTLAAAVLRRYDADKRRQGWLDYDDLIVKAGALLDRAESAAWVRYKLDGEVNHVLVDEAQDTNPDQWRVIRALTAEFFAGDGTHLPGERSLFAVGDRKQSIFSFQRAEPRLFGTERERVGAAATAVGAGWDAIALPISFRSTRTVLSVVDAVLAQPAAARGVLDPDEGWAGHRVFRSGQAGRVELLPLIPARDPAASDDAPDPWSLRREADSGWNRAEVLGRRLAQLIAGWLDHGEQLPARAGRAVRAGDIMILVRRRAPYAAPITRALKAAGIAVASADRVSLLTRIGVQDMVALLSFLALPGDDLALAGLLKSPLFGWDEDRLYKVCHDRESRWGSARVWGALRAMAAEDERAEEAQIYLADLLDRADFERPFDLLARVLGVPCPGDDISGRRALLGRLGADAVEPVDELLSMALAYERVAPPSLQGFLAWLSEAAPEVKREGVAGEEAVRILTVHGAKGLQAPIVILADAVIERTRPPTLLWGDELAPSSQAVPMWVPKRELAGSGPAADALIRVMARAEEENNRLLYVAMTRAEDRLYAAGVEPSGRLDSTWYGVIKRGLEQLGAVPLDRPYDHWSGAGLRLDDVQEAYARPVSEPDPLLLLNAAEARPAWLDRPPPPEPDPSRPLSPSRPSTPEPAARSPLLYVKPTSGLLKGRLVHGLLAALPGLPPNRRLDIGARYLQRLGRELASGEAEHLLVGVLAILEDPTFKDVFGPDALEEVPITGIIGRYTVSGQIDRLILKDNEALIIDYKTNRPPPAVVDDVPSAYLRQLAAYRAVIRATGPLTAVRCALLWTETAHLMPIPDAVLDAYERML
jgi:ATP-dependent helicase/nuclease subunit A